MAAREKSNRLVIDRLRAAKLDSESVVDVFRRIVRIVVLCVQ